MYVKLYCAFHKHANSYPVCISIFFPVEHELWWPKRVCAAKQMIFGVLRHKVLIYDFHMFKTSKFIIPSWKRCVFGPVIFNRVWTLAACDTKTPFITDTVGTLSLCPDQLDSVIEGVQSNAPSLLLFSARISLRCLHDLNAWLVTCLFVPGTWLLSVVIGESVTAGCP